MKEAKWLTGKSKCEKCGQWCVGNVEHDCQPDVPIALSFFLDCGLGEMANRDFDVLGETYKLSKILGDEGIHFDSGCGGGFRDWQFEMLNASERKRVVEVAEQSGLNFKTWRMSEGG